MCMIAMQGFHVPVHHTRCSHGGARPYSVCRTACFDAHSGIEELTDNVVWRTVNHLVNTRSVSDVAFNESNKR